MTDFDVATFTSIAYQRPHLERLQRLILKWALCLDAFSTYPFPT